MIHKAKKHLGQNFLKSQGIIKKIVEAGELKEGDTVLEIGPGKGALTEKLLFTGAKVIAVEKDDELIPLLREKFSKNIADGYFALVHGDALAFDPAGHSLQTGKYKVIANIPYNITGAIFKKFLSAESQPERMILMVQKEVADRILARDGKESILSISVKAYGDPKLVVKAPKRFFSPEPKVDSAVIEIKEINRGFFTTYGVKEEDFWLLVRAGFAHKRKLLSGNLKNLDKGVNWANKLAEITGKENIRAENMTLEDWMKLAKSL